jgi:hypothetical protein
MEGSRNPIAIHAWYLGLSTSIPDGMCGLGLNSGATCSFVSVLFLSPRHLVVSKLVSVRSGSNAEHVVSARSERNVVECDRSQVRGLRLLSAFQAIVEIADAKGYARAEKKSNISNL